MVSGRQEVRARPIGTCLISVPQPVRRLHINQLEPVLVKYHANQ